MDCNQGLSETFNLSQDQVLFRRRCSFTWVPLAHGLQCCIELHCTRCMHALTEMLHFAIIQFSMVPMSEQQWQGRVPLYMDGVCFYYCLTLAHLSWIAKLVSLIAGKLKSIYVSQQDPLLHST